MVLVSRFENARNDGQLLQDNARLIERDMLRSTESEHGPSITKSGRVKRGGSHPRVIYGGVGCVQQIEAPRHCRYYWVQQQAFDVLH